MLVLEVPSIKSHDRIPGVSEDPLEVYKRVSTEQIPVRLPLDQDVLSWLRPYKHALFLFHYYLRLPLIIRTDRRSSD